MNDTKNIYTAPVNNGVTFHFYYVIRIYNYVLIGYHDSTLILLGKKPINNQIIAIINQGLRIRPLVNFTDLKNHTH